MKIVSSLRLMSDKEIVKLQISQTCISSNSPTAQLTPSSWLQSLYHP